jgi:hypothetical protein
MSRRAATTVVVADNGLCLGGWGGSFGWQLCLGKAALSNDAHTVRERALRSPTQRSPPFLRLMVLAIPARALWQVAARA